MKPTIYTLILLLSFIFNAEGQKSEPKHMHHKRHMCTATKVGIVSLNVGVVATVGGLLMEWGAGSAYEHNQGNNRSAAEEQYRSDRSKAVAVRDVGIGLGVAGFVLLVTGVTCDIHYNHVHRYSLIAPKSNEVGIAYNF